LSYSVCVCLERERSDSLLRMSTTDNVFKVLDGEDVDTTASSNGGNTGDNASPKDKENGAAGASSSPREPTLSIAQPSEESNDSSAWTAVQSSTRRRLAPQWSISRQDLGVDNSSSKEPAKEGPANAGAGPGPSTGPGTGYGGSPRDNNFSPRDSSTSGKGFGGGERIKKKGVFVFLSSHVVVLVTLINCDFAAVVRHTRDELLALHRPTRVISTLADMPDIISVVTLPPILSEPVDTQMVRYFVLWCLSGVCSIGSFFGIYR
jgi:hypothetical protein